MSTLGDVEDERTASAGGRSPASWLRLKSPASKSVPARMLSRNAAATTNSFRLPQFVPEFTTGRSLCGSSRGGLSFPPPIGPTAGEDERSRFSQLE